MSASGGDVVATAVVARKVRPEHVEAYRAWQYEIDAATSKSPGFIGTETIAPVAGVHDDWVIIFRFDSRENLSRWMQSEQRRELLERGDELLETPADEHTMIGGRPAAHSVTVVVNATPRPGQETKFLAAEKALETAARSFDGFTGYELFEPTQDGGEWTSLYRFAESRYADQWLKSETRARLLGNLHEHSERNVVRKVPSSFGSWFSFNEVDGANTPNWKQSMTVLLMLYPTIPSCPICRVSVPPCSCGPSLPTS
ncbi:antibiotic biosynthesis monooxygenase [Mycobacterium decipiens]|uniref:antibiotic biosynthesis monooxygenase n=1 Tax=Mycobacterium decipiens TaxID=1430326 RepID=UPI001F604A96|nr:antibiotic biosynthesis monooxygenase [Mycobacterium decipiens]